jgi:hypothetical protein
MIAEQTRTDHGQLHLDACDLLQVFTSVRLFAWQHRRCKRKLAASTGVPEQHHSCASFSTHSNEKKNQSSKT